MSEEAVPPKGVDKSKPRSDDSKLKRSASRLAAVQALYQMELSGQPMIKVRDQFEAHRLGAEIDGDQYRDADIVLFRRLLKTALNRQAEIDQMTDRILVREMAPRPYRRHASRPVPRRRCRISRRDENTAQGYHHGICRCCPRLFPGRQGSRADQCRAGRHGAGNQTGLFQIAPVSRSTICRISSPKAPAKRAVAKGG